MTDTANPLNLNVEMIRETRKRIQHAIRHTPCSKSLRLSEMCGCHVYSKLENLQMTGSFKERGAISKILMLNEEERSRGIILASAGNHAQGAAYHAQLRGIPCTVVMPEYTPLVKIANTRRFGANVILHGTNFDAASEHAHQLQKENGCVFVHAFNDIHVMAGQGTIGLEILEQVPDVDAVVVSVGGGGLISGVATAIKETKPNVRVIGVQSMTVPAMKVSLESGELVTVRPDGRTIADGIAVANPGSLTFPIVQRYVDEIITADDDEVARAILLMLETEKTVAEGAGAIPLAGLLHRDLGLDGKRVVMVVSGGNIDVNMVSVIIRRGLVRDGRLVRVKLLLMDRPGTLSELSTLLGGIHANIVQMTHHRTFTSAALGEADVDLDIETEGAEHLNQIMDLLEKHGYKPQIVE